MMSLADARIGACPCREDRGSCSVALSRQPPGRRTPPLAGRSRRPQPQSIVPLHHGAHLAPEC